MKRSVIGISLREAAWQAREDHALIMFLADAQIAAALAYGAPFEGTSPTFADAARMLRNEARRRTAGKLTALTLPGDEALFVLRSTGLAPGQASALLDRACLAAEAAEERLPADRSVRLLVTIARDGRYEVRA